MTTHDLGAEIPSRADWAEDAAREHERNYRQMFDASPNPVVLFDPGTLDIVAANAAAEAYYGPRAGGLLTDLCPPEDAGALAAGVAAAGPVERDRPQRHVRHDGTIIEVSVTTYLTTFAGRKVRCAVITDVTDFVAWETGSTRLELGSPPKRLNTTTTVSRFK